MDELIPMGKAPRNACDAFEEVHARVALAHSGAEAGAAPIDRPFSARAEESDAYFAHLAVCARCRMQSAQAAEWVESLRGADARLGRPSRRFRERLRARLEGERTLRRGFDGPREAAAPRTPQMQAQRVGPVPLIAERRPPKRWLWAPVAVLAGLLVGSWFARAFVDEETPGARTVAAAPSTIETARGADGSSSALSLELSRLRDGLNGEGLVQGDPVATAWWLVAESRASAVRDVTPPDRAQIARAQQAVAAARYKNAQSVAIAVLGLVESAQSLGAENLAASVDRLLGSERTSAPTAQHAGLGDTIVIERSDRARGQVDGRERKPQPAAFPSPIGDLASHGAADGLVQRAIDSYLAAESAEPRQRIESLLSSERNRWASADVPSRADALRAVALATMLRGAK